MSIDLLKQDLKQHRKNKTALGDALKHKQEHAAFKKDVLTLFLRLNGGHAQHWMYGTNKRPDGTTGSGLYSDFIANNRHYYPIKAESALIHEVINKLSKEYDTMVEFGVGTRNSLLNKTARIIRTQPNLKRFYGFDISQENLDTARQVLSKHVPGLTLHDVCANFYTKRFRPQGKHVLGSFLGTTISNLNMMVGGTLPRNELTKNLKKLVTNSKGTSGGSLLFSFDANDDWNQIDKAYSHPLHDKVIIGLMHDIHDKLKPEGNFNPLMWQHVQINDKKNHVKHLCIAPKQDQFFKIGRYEFEFRKDDTPLVITNCFKIPVDVMLGMVEEAGLKRISAPISADDNPMVMLEVA